MFQFRRFPTYYYLIHSRFLQVYCRGFPHSEISGSKLICSSPKLIAACHVLHRLLMPRHSPCALSSLISSKQMEQFPQTIRRFPLRMLCSLAPLLLLSNSNPLRWALNLFGVAGAQVPRFLASCRSTILEKSIRFSNLVELCRLIFQKFLLS